MGFSLNKKSYSLAEDKHNYESEMHSNSIRNSK